tara:strand:+ start:902 stop:1066 length:165 start_codon:yes stop_codon:yes gene_type:complete
MTSFSFPIGRLCFRLTETIGFKRAARLCANQNADQEHKKNNPAAEERKKINLLF